MAKRPRGLMNWTVAGPFGFADESGRSSTRGWASRLWFALASRALTIAQVHATTPRQPHLSQAQQDQILARAARSALVRRSVPRGELHKAQASQPGPFS